MNGSLSEFVHAIIIDLDHRFIMPATRKRLSRKCRSAGFRAPHDRPGAIDLARRED
jgi:hypothetical protein